jgi:hypothetical protein
LAIKNFTVSLGGQLLGTFDVDQITIDDAITFENETGMTINEMRSGLSDMSRGRTTRALVWYMKYKYGTAQPINSINFALTELEVVAIPDPKAPAAPKRSSKVTSESSGTSSE